jgi:pimeloyl-ACP methyl ester carboxylesterase
MKAAALTLEVLDSPVRPLSALSLPPTRSKIETGYGDADLYRPRGLSSAPRLVLVHGVNPEGKDDPRVRRLAAAFARSGREILVPQLELRRKKLDLEDLDRIRSAVRLPSRARGVGVVAFSYGAGLALVALAQDQETQRRVRFIATVGTYFDLGHLLQGVTTGTVPYRGANIDWETVPDARLLVAEQLASFIGGPSGKALLQAWKSRDPLSLDPGTRSVYEMLDNRDPQRVPELLEHLPSEIRELLRSLSPSAAIDRISVPVIALHSGRDRAAPPTESRLLVEAVRTRTEAALFEVQILEHVSPQPTGLGSVRDVAKLAAFASLILKEQEGWPRL